MAPNRKETLKERITFRHITIKPVGIALNRKASAGAHYRHTETLGRGVCFQ
jgi:hypothetical protein